MHARWKHSVGLHTSRIVQIASPGKQGGLGVVLLLQVWLAQTKSLQADASMCPLSLLNFMQCSDLHYHHSCYCMFVALSYLQPYTQLCLTYS
jgi:hypothetical protein